MVYVCVLARMYVFSYLAACFPITFHPWCLIGHNAPANGNFWAGVLLFPQLHVLTFVIFQLNITFILHLMFNLTLL
jgi:hypothetical protein